MAQFLRLLTCRPPKPPTDPSLDESLIGYPYPSDLKRLRSPSSSTTSSASTTSPAPLPSDPNEDSLANTILWSLRHATNQDDLERQLASLVHSATWRSSLAERVLHGIEASLTEIQKLGGVMKKAYDVVVPQAEKFVREHPVYAAVIGTVVALGIMYLLLPWALEWLGFEAVGVRAGSWAARWMSRVGDVEKGSLLAWLQSLGATWMGVVKVTVRVHRAWVELGRVSEKV